MTSSGTTSADFCGTTQAARLLDLSVGTVQALVESGALQAWKTRGGHRRIAVQSILDYQRRQGQVPRAPGLPGARLRVLVVEDDDDLRAFYQAHFDAWALPLALTLTGSALDALVNMASLQPDVLITDLKMPGVDGFELLRTLRAKPVFARMTLVAATGLSARAVARAGGLPEGTVLMHKPLDMNWLHGFLTALLARHGAGA